MIKRGAVFLNGDRRARFCFADALKGDHPDAYQVPRDDFDQVLAREARRAGVDVRFGQQVTAVNFLPGAATITISAREREVSYDIAARFVLDCSGYGRVLPALLALERPSSLPTRVSCFNQVECDDRPDGDLEGDIWICVHPENGWIWIIPFSNGRTSVGMVCDAAHWEAMAGNQHDKLVSYLQEEPNAWARLHNAVAVAPTRVIRGYSKSVASLYGEGWALAGNASDFLDPVFSSGVSLALETGTLAAGLIDRTLAGEAVDWHEEYRQVVEQMVGVFQAFVESWYRRDLETIFFSDREFQRIKRFITSILGGHVLRSDNPLLQGTEAALRQLHEMARDDRDIETGVVG